MSFELKKKVKRDLIFREECQCKVQKCQMFKYMKFPKQYNNKISQKIFRLILQIKLQEKFKLNKWKTVFNYFAMEYRLYDNIK